MRGRDKLTEIVRGQPLLRDRAAMLHETGCFSALIVVLSDREERRQALTGLPITPVLNPSPKDGMGSSIAIGVSALDESVDGVMILPSDLPDLTSDDIRAVADSYHSAPNRIHRATTSKGEPGSPVIFPRAFFPKLRAIDPQESGRAVIAAHKELITHVRLPNDAARRDLDTPEDWARWRADQQGQS